MKIVLTCKTGITTSLLIEKMEALVKSKRSDIEFKAVAETAVANEVGNFDILLVGPQVSVAAMQTTVGNAALVKQITTGDYTTLDVEHILDDAMEAYKAFCDANGKSIEMSILISCTTGISSSLIVENMQKVAKEKHLNIHVKGVPETEIINEVENFDVLLVGPQISLTKIKAATSKDIPMETINTGFYSTINGAGILNQAATLYNNK